MKAAVVLFLVTIGIGASSCRKESLPAPKATQEPPSILETISDLAAQGRTLRSVPFPTVVEGSTGRKVLPVEKADPVGTEIIAGIATAVAESISVLNQEDSPVRKLRRINEASRFFEDEILRRLNSTEIFTCELPPTAGGKAQRSGYPDLKITHKPSGRVAYLDPKLFEQGGRSSTLRTFYFEPKTETNKILDDAHHLLIGIEHDGNDGAWQFTNWHLVDLSKLVVRLKPEFQASNRDVYGSDAILKSDHE